MRIVATILLALGLSLSFGVAAQAAGKADLVNGIVDR